MTAERDQTLSDSAVDLIRSLREQYEQACKSDFVPRIEDYVLRVPEEVRSAAYRELSALAAAVYGLPDGQVDYRGDSAMPTESWTSPVSSPISENAGLRTDDALSEPERLGRYTVRRRISRGGFGDVYLGEDPELGRLVALKIPREDRLHSEAELTAFFEEARTTVRLEHPGVVPVYDVFREGDRVVIVQRYIPGGNLAALLGRGPVSAQRAAELLAIVADVIAFAHQQGFIHRDLKPSNILLDDQGQPLVADFGLALHESVQRGHRGDSAGTRKYRSPEQVLGEAHRMDGRSDIWSLGVVLYEMLSGRFPFDSRTPRELDEEILNRDPWPLRMRNASIPAELDRICQKSLAKRASERYSSASELAEDLRHWLRGGTKSAFVDDKVPIIPKGLRSFSEEDADAYLDLLPGPRDRTGLPESIRFWQTRIEQTDADRTFAVGVIYGPSGCGKSSLVKAGLLPRLAAHVIPVYVEATSDDTVGRLLNRLRRVCPEIDGQLSLPQVLGLLREGRWVPRGRKILLIVDQFEQWLHVQQPGHDRALVQAIRQCDGSRVQCLFLVRDDFWSATSRFMRELDIRPVDGENLAFVDRFDLLHARQVLTALGKAYGRLPSGSDALSDDQEQFVERAVSELAQDGKVVCVRLALFADMMRGTPWTTNNLRQAGGAEGLGAAFLEATFSAAMAPAEYRCREKTARAVLQALLPEAGSDIKGGIRSHGELRRAVGNTIRSADFDEVIRMLDSELRLLTPTDPDGVEPRAEASSVPADSGPEKYYQLTHDYLVPALRDWLTRKQKGTRRGRAELRLADRASFWSLSRESRQLPTAWETLRILALTKRERWTTTQTSMMRQATRLHGLRLAGALVLVVAGLLSLAAARTHWREVARGRHAEALAERLLTADMPRVPEVLAEMQSTRDLWTSRLRAIADDPARDRGEKLRANLALLPQDRHRVRDVFVAALDEAPAAIRPVREQLAANPSPTWDGLWRIVADPALGASRRLRAAAILAHCDPGSSEWASHGLPVARTLVSDNALDADLWADLLHPVRETLIPTLVSQFLDDHQGPLVRSTAARVLARLGDTQLLSILLLDADAAQFPLLLQALEKERETVVAALEDTVTKPLADASPPERPELARRQRNAAAGLLQFGRPERVWPLLEGDADGSARTLIILSLRDFGVSIETLWQAETALADPVARQALWLAIKPYLVDELDADSRLAIGRQLAERLRAANHQAERSALQWLLKSLEWHEEPEPQLAAVPDSLEHNWWVNSQGQTLRVFDAPVTFLMGAPPDEGRETQHVRRLERRFALSVYEVTVKEYLRFDPDASYDRDVSPDENCPIGFVSWLDAAKYCRWLSEIEGVPTEQMCYPPIEEINEQMTLPADLLLRTGYRLPTEAEWEYACRAGTSTPWFFGGDERHVPEFGWAVGNSRERCWPVGTRMPNPFGLFDMIGNVHEWCHDGMQPYPIADLDSPAGNGVPEDPGRLEIQRVIRGGCYRSIARALCSAQRNAFSIASRYSIIGFRLARTLPDDERQ